MPATRSEAIKTQDTELLTKKNGLRSLLTGTLKYFSYTLFLSILAVRILVMVFSSLSLANRLCSEHLSLDAFCEDSADSICVLLSASLLEETSSQASAPSLGISESEVLAGL